MDIVIALAAVFLAAVLKASRIKRHGGFLGMKKTEPKLGKDHENS